MWQWNKEFHWREISDYLLQGRANSSFYHFFVTFYNVLFSVKFKIHLNLISLWISNLYNMQYQMYIDKGRKTIHFQVNFVLLNVKKRRRSFVITCKYNPRGLQARVVIVYTPVGIEHVVCFRSLQHDIIYCPPVVFAFVQPDNIILSDNCQAWPSIVTETS